MVSKRKFSEEDSSTGAVPALLSETEVPVKKSRANTEKRRLRKEQAKGKKERLDDGNEHSQSHTTQDGEDTEDILAGQKPRAAYDTELSAQKVLANPGQFSRKKLKKLAKKVNHDNKLALSILGVGSRVELTLKVAEYFKKSGHDKLTLRHAQSVVLWALADGRNPKEWMFLKNMSLIKKTMTIMIDGLTMEMYTKFGGSCPNIAKINNLMPLLFPASQPAPANIKNTNNKNKNVDVEYMSESLKSYLNSGIPLQRRRLLNLGKGREETAQVGENGTREVDLPPNSHYILTREELTANNFPSWYPGWTGEMLTSGVVPNMKGYQGSHKDHVPTKEDMQKIETSNTRVGASVDYTVPVVDDIDRSLTLPVFSIDCEMCETADGPALTRVSIVNEAADIVMDELVMPDVKITNYLTQFSGMTAELLEGVTTTVRDIQKKIRALIPPNAILLGHSLENDLKALKIVHRRVVDTSLLYPHAGGGGLKNGLKALCRTYLDRMIQDGVGGHNSVEDARAALSLYKLKMEKGPQFGVTIKEDQSESMCTRLARQKKSSVMVDKMAAIKEHESALLIDHRNDEQAVAAMLKQYARDINFHHIRLFGVSDYVKSFHTDETVTVEITPTTTTTSTNTPIQPMPAAVLTTPALREGSTCLSVEDYKIGLQKVLATVDAHVGILVDALEENTVLNVISGPGVLPPNNVNKTKLYEARHGFMFLNVI
eukprot:CFRG1795T1